MSTSIEEKRFQGRVKWFNNGYGFITMNKVEGEEGDTDKDVFVHHSSVTVQTSQYKYLVQGEYVEFSILPIEKGDKKYDFQAVNVTGINGGKLLCETRREYKLEQGKYKNGEEEKDISSRGTNFYRGRGRGRGEGFRRL
jgi:cold shock CspA family protein